MAVKKKYLDDLPLNKRAEFIKNESLQPEGYNDAKGNFRMLV